jgi:hypothetical protein
VAGDSFVTQSVTRNDLLPEQKDFDRCSSRRARRRTRTRASSCTSSPEVLREKIAVIHPLAYIALPVTQSKAIGGVNADAMGTYRTFLEKTGYLA